MHVLSHLIKSFLYIYFHLFYANIHFLWDYTSLKFAVANCLPPRAFLASQPHCNLWDLHCVNFFIYIRSSFELIFIDTIMTRTESKALSILAKHYTQNAPHMLGDEEADH